MAGAHQYSCCSSTTSLGECVCICSAQVRFIAASSSESSAVSMEQHSMFAVKFFTIMHHQGAAASHVPSTYCHKIVAVIEKLS